MTDPSAALFRAANLQIMDYPFEAALQSALSICDEAVVVVGQSVDNTLEHVYCLQDKHGADRITVVESYFHYDRLWQQKWWQEAVSYTDAEWLMWADADEVIHEDDAPTVRQNMDKPGVGLIRLPFIHFYATADYTIKFNLTHNSRLGRRSLGYKMVNLCDDQHPGSAACAMKVNFQATGYVDYNAHIFPGPELVNVNAPIYHYGWARNAFSLAMSQAKYRAWYADGDGLEEGNLPEVEPWPFRDELPIFLESGRCKRFDGSHPKYTKDWFEDHSREWTALDTFQE